MTRLLRSIQFSLFLAALLSINLTIAQQVQLGKNFTLSLGDNAQSSTDDPNIKDLLNYYKKQIYFTQNKGQWNSTALYKADFPLGQAVATKEGMLVGTYNPQDESKSYDRGIREEETIARGERFEEPKVVVHGHGWLMQFVGNSPEMNITSQGMHSDKFNYFIGETQETNVSSYQEIWYNHVYDNVDVRYYPSEQGTLEYDIVCKPGFDKNKIAIQYKGIDKMYLNENGELILKTSVGDMTFPSPVAYQNINKKRVAVDAKYVLTGNTVSFELGSFDASQPLVIDPIALRWATWITTGSANDDHGHGIWVDPNDGAIYVMARFTGTGLITANAFQGSTNGGLDIVLGKYLEPATVGGAGTRVWQTYIGGSGDENPYAMEQGPDGNLYMTGYTSSTDLPFNGGLIDNENNQNTFVLRINTAGNTVKAATIGGNGTESPFDLRITSAGDILVCGSTTSSNLGTKYGGNASNTNAGGSDIMIFKIAQNLNSITWMRNYGGDGVDQAAIMLNNPVTGEIFVGGFTSSTNLGMLSARANNNVIGGTQSGFLQKLGSDGHIKWSSYFRSADTKIAQILCMEFNTSKSQLYFGGLTTGLHSSNISASGVLDNSYNGDAHDFFVCRMDANQNFVAATYLGGSADEINMMGLNVDLNNDVYIFGYSNSSDFPTTSLALQSTKGTGYDKTFTKIKFDLSGSGSPLKPLFSTFYGGNADDYDPVGERGIKFSNCRIYTIVTSKSTNLPITTGALLQTRTGSNYEPGLVVWANPPDLIGNTISGSQTICTGSTPSDFTGSVPSYNLPSINTGNGTGSVSYPVSLPTAAVYQWQRSADSTSWSDISGATTQNLAAALIGPLYQKTYFRRIIGGDACVIAGAANQSIKVKVLSVPGIIHNVTCFGFNNGSVTANPDGTPSYSYVWGNGATTQTISNL
ncbi:MAG: SprB repeat-containing protein, partial [Bacteroidota bacterium]